MTSGTIVMYAATRGIGGYAVEVAKARLTVDGGVQIARSTVDGIDGIPPRVASRTRGVSVLDGGGLVLSARRMQPTM